MLFGKASQGDVYVQMSDLFQEKRVRTARAPPLLSLSFSEPELRSGTPCPPCLLSSISVASLLKSVESSRRIPRKHIQCLRRRFYEDPRQPKVANASSFRPGRGWTKLGLQRTSRLFPTLPTSTLALAQHFEKEFEQRPVFRIGNKHAFQEPGNEVLYRFVGRLTGRPAEDTASDKFRDVSSPSRYYGQPFGADTSVSKLVSIWIWNHRDPSGPHHPQSFSATQSGTPY